jgi:hypothetical protein
MEGHEQRGSGMDKGDTTRRGYGGTHERAEAAEDLKEFLYEEERAREADEHNSRRLMDLLLDAQELLRATEKFGWDVLDDAFSEDGAGASARREFLMEFHDAVVDAGYAACAAVKHLTRAKQGLAAS